MHESDIQLVIVIINFQLKQSNDTTTNFGEKLEDKFAEFIYTSHFPQTTYNRLLTFC